MNLVVCCNVIFHGNMKAIIMKNNRYAAAPRRDGAGYSYDVLGWWTLSESGQGAILRWGCRMGRIRISMWGIRKRGLILSG